MQIIAMLTMLIDHIGLIFYPGEPGWREVGRLAFPIYCYALVQGHLHTSSRPRYWLRLLLIALLAQIPYQLALVPGGLNVVFTLLASGLVLALLDTLPPSPWLRLGIIAAACWLMDLLPMDYNAYGLLLVLVYRYFRGYRLIAAHLGLNLVYFLLGWHGQMLSLVPTLAMVLAPSAWSRLEGWRVPRGVWWSFYPVHLLLLAGAKAASGRPLPELEWPHELLFW
ncbi:TraX family protein [Paenibacillus glufosinatiresistens]|uniref:TraX family protein n=1 Tax=Paenibacillus glufosinatiresistens TaxID=3070657 RepID=UPI00286E7ECD|nr:TraX family protein [Paenibacillus sp. YX.27]